MLIFQYSNAQEFPIPYPILPGYLDVGGAVIRVVEDEVSKRYREQVDFTYNQTKKIAKMAALELSSRAPWSGVSAANKVDFTPYMSMCNVYRNPNKKKLCKSRIEYLEKAHEVTYGLMRAKLKYPITNGNRGKIWSKYANINTMIFYELEKIKEDAKKRKNKYKFWKY